MNEQDLKKTWPKKNICPKCGWYGNRKGGHVEGYRCTKCGNEW